MAGEIRQRKNAEKSEEKEEKLPVEKKITKKVVVKRHLPWWTMAVTPFIAMSVVTGIDSFLDGQISGLEGQVTRVELMLKGMNEVWPVEKADRFIAEFKKLNETLQVQKKDLMEYIKGEFTEVGDPGGIQHQMDTLLEDLRTIKTQEDERFKIVKQARETLDKAPSLVSQLKQHEEGMRKSTKQIKEIYDAHSAFFDENELGAGYVNLTEPISELQGKRKISEVLETCRATGAQRFIATEYLTFYKRLLNEAFDKIKSGRFNSIPDPVAQTEDLNPYFDRYVEAKKEYLSFHNFTQDMRDRIEHIAINEKFSKNERIRLADTYGTPKEYFALVSKLVEYQKLKPMSDLIVEAKGTEKTIRDMYKTNCGQHTEAMIQSYTRQIHELSEKIDKAVEKSKEYDFKQAFDRSLVEEVRQREAGLERFIYKLKAQIVVAETAAATKYYNFVRSQKATLTKKKSKLKFVG